MFCISYSLSDTTLLAICNSSGLSVGTTIEVSANWGCLR